MKALAIALLLNFIFFWFSDKIALRSAGAKPISESEAPQLYQIAERRHVLAEERQGINQDVAGGAQERQLGAEPEPGDVLRRLRRGVPVQALPLRIGLQVLDQDRSPRPHRLGHRRHGNLQLQ